MSDKKGIVAESPETRWIRQKQGEEQAEKVQAAIEAAKKLREKVIGKEESEQKGNTSLPSPVQKLSAKSKEPVKGA